MRRLLILFTCTCALFLSGCLSSSPSKRYFQLSPTALTGVKGSVTLPQSVKIEKVDTERIYNDYRVIYRPSPFRLDYYTYDFWVQRPGKMLEELFFKDFTATRLFSRVERSFSQESSHFLLRVHLTAIEENVEGKSSWAHLGMSMELLDSQTRRSVVSHSFDRKEPLKGRKMENLIALLSRILGEEMALFTQKITDTLGRGTPPESVKP